ncbi:MAG: hypothetical protein GVX96_04705 [Bacteroidetes bacterium]|jgi:hypothetical protein|nr:hypothetical protein [Bacteroidota bacterium]
MAQTQWTYHSPSGRSYHVGLYHGDDSGHVIIYCNNNILTVDFNVQEDKSYSFYLEKDLCELSLNQHKDGFDYDFQITNSAKAPKSTDGLEPVDYIYLGLATVLIIGIIVSVLLAIH